jgi:hypothetical protein
MPRDTAVSLDALPGHWQRLFRPTENDRRSKTFFAVRMGGPLVPAEISEPGELAEHQQWKLQKVQRRAAERAKNRSKGAWHALAEFWPPS